MEQLIEGRDPKYIDLYKAANHFEIMVSMGCSAEMLEDLEKDKFEEDMMTFMDAYSIDHSEYQTVVDFYNKVYQNFRAQQPDSGQIHSRNPEIWELRQQFLEKSGVRGKSRRKADRNPKAVWYMKEQYGFCWLKFNIEALDDEALAYLVSNVALCAANQQARARALDYMWDEMEDSTLYDLYKGVKDFERLNVALA